MKSVLKIVLVLAIVGGLVYSGFLLYDKSEEQPVIYDTKQPEYRDIIKKTVATGSIAPRQEVDIKPQVSGIIDKLYIEAGDSIKKGDLIARVRIVPNLVSLNNAEVRVKTSKINLQNAKETFDRYRQLFRDSIISANEFQQYKTDYDLQQAELTAAQDNLQLIREGATSKAGKNSTNLVRATVSGMVLDVPVKEGSQVIESNTFNEGTTVATVADMNDMLFIGKIDEAEVGRIHEKMPLIITIGAIEDRKFAGLIEYISPKGMDDEGAIKFEIKASVKLLSGYFVRAGYSANADIILERKDSVLTISESLLKFEDNKAYVEVETEPQTFEKKYVTLGLSDGIFTEIKGLDTSSRIKVQESYGAKQREN